MNYRHELRRGVSIAAVVVGLLSSGAVAEAAGSPAASAATSKTASLPAPPANGEMAFVFSEFTPAVYADKAACAGGLANMVRDNYLTTVPAAERARLLKPENEPELTAKWKAYGVPGPARRNLCTNYDEFPDHPLYKTVQSKIAYGVNLDGDTSGKPADPYVCPHQNFTGPTGEKGVDNQAYRAMGCERNWRATDRVGEGEIHIGWKSSLLSDYTVVLILRNVHSLVNDDNVEVILASAADTPIIDSQQNFVRDASYRVLPTPQWRNVLHGHIHNGVLTTDTKDVLLGRSHGADRPVYRVRGVSRDFDFAHSKLELTFKPDGTLDGVIGGYAPLTTFMTQEIGGGAGTVSVADIDCASQYVTLKKLADGERDPSTGQCNRISTVLKLEAVPAFVFDEPATTKTAAK